MMRLWAQLMLGNSDYLYLLPLVVVVSLVYSGTRHEEWSLIWRRAIRLGIFILVFMGLTLALLLGLQLL